MVASGRGASCCRDSRGLRGVATCCPVRDAAHGYDHGWHCGRPAERKGATVGVLQRFERRLEGMVGLAFARIFKGKVHPAEIAKALQREADEQRSVVGEGRVLAPNVYVVTLGEADFQNLAQWSGQLADELADMVTEHMDEGGSQVLDRVPARLERDDELPPGVSEVSSPAPAPPRPVPHADPVGAPPTPGHPPL